MGKEFYFWEDTWCKDFPLAVRYKSLYDLAASKGVCIADTTRNFNDREIKEVCKLYQ